jgi:hypothetical protein
MRISLAVLGVGTAICIATAPLNAIAAPSHGDAKVAAKAVTAVASWEMNEPTGATTMLDSSGNGINGNIVASDQITTGFIFDGATGYHWVRKGPNQLPVQPERIIQVPDDDRLEATDASETYTVQIRFRTKENFGNVIQKGQATTKGGQFKIQNPQGRPSCLFNGSIGRVSTRATIPINDNAWHVLTCVRTSTRVTLLIDGVENNHHNGSTGAINNAIPLTIGGKINCDQINITCDYFSGEIDWVRITKGS